MPIRLVTLFGLLCFLLLAAAPAHASICSKYDKPITQGGFAAYAQEVKDLFPVRYRRVLDTATLEVTNESEDQLFMAQTGREYSITVSANYLKANCVMGLWALMNGSKAAEPGSSHSIAARVIGDLCKDDASRRACVLSFMDEAETKVQNEESQKQFYSVVEPVLDQAMRSAFRFALAHEFAHVLNEADKTPYRKLAKSDSELAADLQALTTLASGRIWHVSDTLLFSGRRLFESLVGAQSYEADTHDTATCRAARSNFIREKVTQDLWEISQWRSRTDMSLALTPLAMTGSGIGAALAMPASDCASDIPDAVRPMFDDISRLGAWAKAQPKDAQGPASGAELAQTKMVSEFGAVVRDSMIVSSASSPFFQAAVKIGGTELGPKDVATVGTLAGLVARPKSTGNLSATDHRKAAQIAALNDYFTSPRKSSFRANASKLRHRFEANGDHSMPDPLDMMLMAVTRSMDGDCETVMDTARTAMIGLLQPMREMQSLMRLSESLPFSSQETGTKAPLDQEFEKIVEGMPKADEKQIDQCKRNFANAQKHMIKTFGWVD